MSQDAMFARSHFPVPQPPAGFHVVVPGRPQRLVSPRMLDTFDTIERGLVLECAGNGRSLMNAPIPKGVPWRLGGASPLNVQGVRLADVLGGLPEDIVDVVFTGADQGLVGSGRVIPFQFSISRELAISNIPILATHIGGTPLTREHGAPVRLIVPGHYGMKSVKWLTRIEAITEKFRGHFVEEYSYYGDPSIKAGTPVDEIAVRSVISSPVAGASWTSPMEIRGSSWTGGGAEVAIVAVTVDDGETWHEADLVRQETAGPWGPMSWSVVIDVEPVNVTVMARATDTRGNTQPLEPPWNSGGYANNAVHRITVEVLDN
jgi:DMSO/TMAO reductase YedYZ molybdopterin-dependent catalytic subunit